MIDIILLIIVCFFCTFGVIEFCKMLFFCANRKYNKFFTVLPFYNDENVVECNVRTCMLHNYDTDIIALDLGSTDNSLKILHNLEEEYNNLYIYDLSDFLDMIEGYYE